MTFRYYVEDKSKAKKCKKKRIALQGTVQVTLPPFFHFKNIDIIVDYVNYCLVHPQIFYGSLMASKCYIYFEFPKRS